MTETEVLAAYRYLVGLSEKNSNIEDLPKPITEVPIDPKFEANSLKNKQEYLFQFEQSALTKEMNSYTLIIYFK